jgi:hypothetical protein
MRSSRLLSAWCTISLLFITTLAENQTSYPELEPFGCGNSIENASESLIQAHEMLHQQELQLQSQSANETFFPNLEKRQSPTIVKTYAHMIAADDGYSLKLLTPLMPQSQTQVLYQAYKGSSFSFQLSGLHWHNKTS